MFLRIIRQKLNEESGAVVVLVVFALTALLGATALVVDAGMVYRRNAQLSNAVDAAALAGIQALPADPALAQTLAESYALKNGVSAENLNIEISDNNHEIKVAAKSTVNHLFAQIIGVNSTDVVKSAGAKVGNLSAAAGAVPFSLEAQELVYNEEYVLKSVAGGGQDGEHTGWFGALRLGGNGASNYEKNIKNGYQQEITIGDLLEIENGNMSGPTTLGVNDRIAQCKHTPACTSASFVEACPRLVTIPVVEACSKKTVKVKGFAKFFLERVDGQGNKNNVWGTFVQLHAIGEMTEDGESDYGIYISRLSY